MKSGDLSASNDACFREAFAGIRDPNFVQRTFLTRPALIAKEPVNGHRMSKDYHGGPYDQSKFDLVEGVWDHDHCSVCWFKIRDGHTYWENGRRIKLLCDACHEVFEGIRSQPPGA
jgi:hypothetical protein